MKLSVFKLSCFGHFTLHLTILKLYTTFDHIENPSNIFKIHLYMCCTEKDISANTTLVIVQITSNLKGSYWTEFHEKIFSLIRILFTYIDIFYFYSTASVL